MLSYLYYRANGVNRSGYYLTLDNAPYYPVFMASILEINFDLLKETLLNCGGRYAQIDLYNPNDMTKMKKNLKLKDFENSAICFDSKDKAEAAILALKLIIGVI